jgi:hypothetical protein
MTSDTEREQQLRRLLSEAVDPVEPAPGAQTRLLARARAQAHRKSRGPVILRWGVPVALGSLVVIALVTVVFAVRSANRSDSSASTSAGSATAGTSAPQAARASAGPSSAGSATGQQFNPDVPSPQLSLGKSATTDSGNAGAESGSKAAPDIPLALRPADLDGDGVPDTIAVQGGNLVATLSRDGKQAVSLPPPVGAGAGVLGGATLSDPDGRAATVVFVRLTQAGTAATDTIVALVNGRLTVLRQGSDPVLLTIDPTHGYGCDQRSLALAGNTTPFVVDGTQLVRSPNLRGVITPAAKVVGCY